MIKSVLEKAGYTVGSIKRALTRAIKHLGDYPEELEEGELETEDSGSLIYDMEMSALRLRASFEDKKREYESYESGLFYEESFPVKVAFDGEALRIKTSLTLRRGDSKSSAVLKENYILASYVSAALKCWQEQNKDCRLYLNEKFTGGNLTAVIIRKAKKYNKNVHCDNDNLENGKILNVICSSLGCSDSCRILDLISCFRECADDSGTEFIITGRENALKYIGYI